MAYISNRFFSSIKKSLGNPTPNPLRFLSSHSSNPNPNPSPFPPRTKTPLEREFSLWADRLLPGFTPSDVDVALRSIPDPDLALDLFRWSALRPGFRHTPATYHTALLIAASSRRFPQAESLVDEILSGAAGPPDPPLFNAAIRFCCSRRHLFSTAFDLFKRMQQPRPTATAETYSMLLAEKRKCLSYTGMAQFVSRFAEPGEPEYATPVREAETRLLKTSRIHKLRLEKGAMKAAEDLQKYDPSKDLNTSGDPYKTLFVAKLNYEITEQKIKREFEAYGPIKRVRLITDKVTNKPRGYAFIEYMHTRDMKTAYKLADGMKLDGRRIFVDVERGRTVPDWRPRRLGGGLGSTRVSGEDFNHKDSGRDHNRIESGPPRSEEPRAHDVQQHDRPTVPSRERGRNEVRENPREHSRKRDWDLREERHDPNKIHDRHRDRDVKRDHQHDRVRSRDMDRDHGRDLDRKCDRDREHARERNQERDNYASANHEKTRGYLHESDIEYDHVEPTYRSERSPGRKRDHDRQELYEPSKDHDYDKYDQSRYSEHYDHVKPKNAMRNQEKVSYDGRASHHDGREHADPESCEEGEAIEVYDYHQSERTTINKRDLSPEYRG